MISIYRIYYIVVCGMLLPEVRGRSLLWVVAATCCYFTLGSVIASEVVTVHNGAELAAAFSNPQVAVALVDSQRVVLTSDDFSPYAPPIQIARNFTIQGVWQDNLNRFPYFDFGFVRGKVGARGNGAACRGRGGRSLGRRRALCCQ